MKCWICGDPAGSGEHLVKASDIRARLGPVSPGKPLYVHQANRRNKPVRGVKSNALKSKAPMCSTCNNQRTQPHDIAWEKLSAYIGSRPKPLCTGDRIRLHKVFPGSIHRSMLYVHLFFAKLLGCRAIEGNVPLDTTGLAYSILHNDANPYLHLAICAPFVAGVKRLGTTDMHTMKDKLTGKTVAVGWFYYLDTVTVRIIYDERRNPAKGIIQTWHPSTIGKYLRIASNYS